MLNCGKFGKEITLLMSYGLFFIHRKKQYTDFNESFVGVFMLWRKVNSEEKKNIQSI